MHQQNCATCGKTLEPKLIQFDLIQCSSCYEKWKSKYPSNPVAIHIDHLYEIANPKQKPPKIDLGGMVI